MSRQANEFTLFTVVVHVYAPKSWTDAQGQEALLGHDEFGNKWDIAIKDLPRAIERDMQDTVEQCAMPEGIRFEVTS
jgi:hypothetical protein